jgi:hypothetical protein
MRSTQRGVIVNVCTFSHKVHIILALFKCNLNSIHRFLKKILRQNLLKIRPVGASCSTRMDGHDDAVTCRSFANAPKT